MSCKKTKQSSPFEMSKFRQAERPGGKFGSVDSGLEFPPKDLDRSRRFEADPDLLAVDILDRDQGHHWRAHGIPCRAFEGLAYADEAPVAVRSRPDYYDCCGYRALRFFRSFNLSICSMRESVVSLSSSSSSTLRSSSCSRLYSIVSMICFNGR